MLGWHISIYRQTNDGASPATFDSPEGARLAVWQADVGGLGWIHELVKSGKAIALGGNSGYPNRYTASAEHLMPQITGGALPGPESTWILGAGDIVTDKWEGKTVINNAEIAGCRPDEWLLIEAWDES